MIGWERCGRGGRDKTKVKEKGPKVCRRIAETVSIAWKSTCFSKHDLYSFTGFTVKVVHGECACL